MMKRYENYIFDLYGTLAAVETNESAMSLWKSMCKIYDRYGVHFASWQTMRSYYRTACEIEFQKACVAADTRYGEMNLLHVFEEPLSQAGRKDCSQLAVYIAGVFRALSIRQLHVYEDTIETLQSLRAQNKKIYLLSNAQTVFTMEELTNLRLVPYFDEIRISSKYGIKKPEPRFLEQLLSERNLSKEETVMIGNDFKTDVQIAQSCGIDSIWINTDAYKQEEIETFLMHTKDPSSVTCIEHLREILGGNQDGEMAGRCRIL